MKTLNIICPVFNEELGIVRFNELLVKELKKLNIESSIYYVDDGSSDNSLAKLIDIKKLNKDIDTKLVVLSRNFGKEAALTAGIQQASDSDYLMCIDADGQYPPSMIKDFLKKIKSNDLVVGIRSDYGNTKGIKKITSQLYYKIANKLGNGYMQPNSTDFRMFTGDFAKSFLEFPEKARVVRGLMDWVGYKVEEIEFEAPDRIAGEATYSYKKLVKLAINGITSGGVKLLYFSLIVGILLTSLALACLSFLVVEDIVLNDPLGLNVSGSGYLVTISLIAMGILLIGQGISSLYIARIYEEVLDRPLYLIKEVI